MISQITMEEIRSATHRRKANEWASVTYKALWTNLHKLAPKSVIEEDDLVFKIGALCKVRLYVDAKTISVRSAMMGDTDYEMKDEERLRQRIVEEMGYLDL